MIGIWLELIQIQNPFFYVDFKINRLNAVFNNTYYDYFYSYEDKLNPVYKINYSIRDFFSNYEKFLISDAIEDSIKSSMEFLNGKNKGVSFYFQRPISKIKFNFNFMSIDDKNNSRFLLYYNNYNFFSGIKIVDKMNLSFFSRYFGVSFNNERYFLYGIFKNFLISYSKDTISIYSYVYIKEPILISHFYINNKKDFFISPLYLLDIDKAVYLVISKEMGFGFKSDFLSFETGYNFNRKLPYFLLNFKSENLIFKLVSYSDKNWLLQTGISRKFWNDNFVPELILTKTGRNLSLGLYTRIVGLILYYSVEMDTLSNFSQYWGARIKFID